MESAVEDQQRQHVPVHVLSPPPVPAHDMPTFPPLHSLVMEFQLLP